MALWLCLFEPWRNHMGTACHSRHYSIGPAAFRTQSITSTEDVKAASEAALQVFLQT